jgi:hypothetical protein
VQSNADDHQAGEAKYLDMSVGLRCRRPPEANWYVKRGDAEQRRPKAESGTAGEPQ